jgi:hypothetical protein
MPLISKHLMMVISKTPFTSTRGGLPAITISCSSSKVIDELVAMDNGNDDMNAIFNVTFNDKQTKNRMDIESRFQFKSTQGGIISHPYHLNEDGMVIQVKGESLWSRTKTGLHATAGAWLTANRAGLRLEHVMDALSMANYDLVASGKVNHDHIDEHMRILHEYIFRRK